MEQLSHCLCALKQIMESLIGERLRCTMQMKALRLNEYEKCDQVIISDLFELYRSTALHYDHYI